MKFYYINHKGIKIDMSNYPYVFQEGDLFDWEFSYDNDGQKTSNYRKKPRKYRCKIAIASNLTNSFRQREKEWKEAVDCLLDVLIVDVIDNQNGRLYTDNGSYMVCKIIASNKSDWRTSGPIIFCELTILTDLPEWITEQSVSISPISSFTVTEEEDLKTYSYTYPYKYPLLQTETNIYIDHYTESDFKLTVYGPATSVYINIAGHPYIVEYPLEAGEYMVIDSRSYIVKEKRLYVVRKNGENVNIFNYRSVEYSVFKKIPAGSITIDYQRTYGIDLTVFKERSEPQWK